MLEDGDFLLSTNQITQLHCLDGLHHGDGDSDGNQLMLGSHQCMLQEGHVLFSLSLFPSAGRPARGQNAACPAAPGCSRGSCSVGRALGTAPPWSTHSAVPASHHQSPHRRVSCNYVPTGRSAPTGAR